MASSSLTNIRKKSSSTTKTRIASCKSQEISPRLKNFPPEEIRKVFDIADTNFYPRKSYDNDRSDGPIAEMNAFPNEHILPPNNTKNEISPKNYGPDFENQNRDEICDRKNVIPMKSEEITHWNCGDSSKAGYQHQNPVFNEKYENSHDQNHVSQSVYHQNPPQNFAHAMCNRVYSRCSQNLPNNSRKCHHETEQRNHQPPKPEIISNYSFTPEMLQDQTYLLSMLKRREIPESVIARQFNSLLDEQKRQLVHMERFSRQEEDESRVERKITKPQRNCKPQWMENSTPPRVSHHDWTKMQNDNHNFQNPHARDYSQNCKKILGPSSLLKLRVYKDVVKPQKSSNGLQDPEIVKRNLETLKELESRTGFRVSENFENKQTNESEQFRAENYVEQSSNANNGENFRTGPNYCQCVCPNQNENLPYVRESNCYERQDVHDNFRNCVSFS